MISNRQFNPVGEVVEPETFKSPDSKLPVRPPSTSKPQLKLSGKPNAFSKPGMVVKKKFEMQDVGPTDQDLKVLADLERAEKERQEIAEENKKLASKPIISVKSGRLEGSAFKHKPSESVDQSVASLNKVGDNFIAPIKLKAAIKEDLNERKQNPNERKF